MENGIKDKSAVLLGKKSWEIRSAGKTKEEIKANMKKVWERSVQVRKERSLTKSK